MAHIHISVCICTYKRPQLLYKLLDNLQNQITEDLFSYSAIIVDNDENKSARDVVTSWQCHSSFRISYYCEPERNIAIARNRAVANADGAFIAFSDDDEFPQATWLLSLYKAIARFQADGVLGPVRPYYPEGTPAWLIKSKLCERSEYKTGTRLHWSQTRTGNVLLSRQLFDESEYWFRSEYGRTGGEDTIFFKEQCEKGKLFVWCNEASVYEVVPAIRWEKRFYLKKSLRIGCGVGDNLRKGNGEFSHPASRNQRYYKIFLNTYKTLWRGFSILARSMLWLAAMTLFLPFAFVLGQHIHMRCLEKLSYNSGVVAGFLGIVFLRYRD